jgi:glycosyltransferase involved in cell wall biosynthesis
MNILIINSAREWGGTEKWALYTAYGLAARGHKVFFGCRGDLFQKRAMNDSVNFVTFPFANNIDVGTVLMIRRFLKYEKIDVVIPSKQREYFLAGLAGKMTKVKVAGLYGIDRPIHNFRNWIVFCKLFNIVFVNAKRIIDVLGQTKKFDTRKCKLVYVGVEPIPLSDSTRKNARNELGIKDDEICLMGIGRVAPQKGFDYGIRALAQIVEKFNKVKFVIVGDGDIQGHRQLASDCGVNDHVIFTGFREDIHSLVQAIDIFWLPSRSEGIPNTMLEAMAAKKPVIVFDIAGVAEVVKNNENGIVVPFEDITGFKTATQQLIDNVGERNRLAENGYKTVVTEYSMEKMYADTERELLSLVAQHY